MLPCFCLTSNFFAWWSPPAQLMAMSQFCWGGRQWCCYGNLHVNSCPLDSPHWSASRLLPERLQCRWSRSHRDQGRQDWVCAGRGEWTTLILLPFLPFSLPPSLPAPSFSPYLPSFLPPCFPPALAPSFPPSLPPSHSLLPIITNIESTEAVGESRNILWRHPGNRQN